MKEVELSLCGPSLLYFTEYIIIVLKNVEMEETKKKIKGEVQYFFNVSPIFQCFRLHNVTKYTFF